MNKAVLFLLLSAILLQLCACGTVSPQFSSETLSPETTPVLSGEASDTGSDLEWKLRSEELYSFGAACTITHMCRLGSTLLLAAREVDNHPLLGLTEVSVTEDGSIALGQLRPVSLNEPDAEDEAMVYALAADEESFYVLCGEFPPMYYTGKEMVQNEAYSGRLRVLRYSPAGELLDEQKLPEFRDAEAPSMLAALDAEHLVLVSNTDVFLYSLYDGQKASVSLPEDGYVLSIQHCGKGIVLSYMNWRSMACFYYLVDSDTGELRDLNFPQSDDPNETLLGGPICQGLNGEYILEANNRFYQLDFDAGSTTELMQWSYSQMSTCQHALRLSEHSFLVQQQDSDHLLAVRMSQEPRQERSTVRVAVYNCGGAADLVREQDNISDRYHYEITEYSGDELDKLLVTMGTKDTPDLLLFCNDLSHPGISTASAAYADLYPFLDADGELSRDSFLPNLLSSLEIEGELHEMWTQTGITSLTIRPEDLGDRSPVLTPADLDEILSATDYEAMFESFMDYENLLKFVAELAMSRYVDRSSGTCHFDDPGFVELVRWCAEMNAPIPEGSDYPYLKSDQVLLGLGSVGSGDISFLDRFPRVFIGFPTGDGQGSYYSQNYMAPVMAIPSAAQNKDGAWAFIHSQLTESAQRKVQFGLPVNYRLVLEQAKASGSPEAFQAFQDLLSTVGFAENNSDNQLRQIILENGLVYCQGDRSLEETIRLIQSKSSLYLAEHYG